MTQRKCNFGPTISRLFNHCALLLLLILSLSGLVQASPGDLDTTFGSGGMVVTSFTNPAYSDQPRSIQVLPDGKIVVCGEVIEYTEESYFTASFFLARYHPTGALDTSFGTNGKVVAPINSGEELVGIKIALQPDGKIIAVGYRVINFLAHFAVNRYNSNGTLDASFGTGGKVVTEIGGNTRQSANSVTVQPDGKIVVVGGASYDSGFVVVRYNSNGSLDTSFGDGGKSITVINNSGYNSGSASAVMLQPDGKIVAAGRYLYHNSYSNTTVGIALVRYNADGSLDSGFGVNGKVLHPLNYFAYLTDAVLQPDGSVVVSVFAGSDYPNFYRARLVVRYYANGSLDTGFAANGIFTAPDTFSSSNYVAGDIALLPNGKILTFGNSNGGIAALRLNLNGSTDTAFGTNGIATATFGSQSSYGWNGAIQPNGRILLLGQAVTSSPDSHSADIGIARLLGDSAVPNNVTIAGRVSTPTGLGLRNAVVTLTDALGLRRTATTGSFGMYSFTDIPTGGTHTISVSSRRYRFAPRSIMADGNLANVDFIGLD